MVDVMRSHRKTIVIIAHRLSTILAADKIIVLQSGKVVEEGRHDELMQNRSNYHDMWRRQFPSTVQEILN
jgi:ATP-binding cassette subfamily B protein